jgi:hypothetical protein
VECNDDPENHLDPLLTINKINNQFIYLTINYIFI